MSRKYILTHTGPTPPIDPAEAARLLGVDPADVICLHGASIVEVCVPDPTPPTPPAPEKSAAKKEEKK